MPIFCLTVPANYFMLMFMLESQVIIKGEQGGGRGGGGVGEGIKNLTDPSRGYLNLLRHFG